MKLRTTLGAIGLVLVLPGLAEAHVTVHPNQLPAGSYAVLDLRVPNETADVDTTRVDVQLPPGFASVSLEPPVGWTAAEQTRKLQTPIQTDDGPVTTEVSQITFTGGRITPGHFLEFPISVGLPDTAGATLTFKALQTYSNGQVVRWIEAPGGEHPAPTIRLAAAGGPILDVAGTAPIAIGSAPQTARSSDDDSQTLPIVALIVGGAGLAAGILAIVTTRRRPNAPTD